MKKTVLTFNVLNTIELYMIASVFILIFGQINEIIADIKNTVEVEISSSLEQFRFQILIRLCF